MEILNEENFETVLHSNDLDSIYNEELDDIESAVFENKDLKQDLKTYFRLFRKKCSGFLREKLQKNFTNIVYLTLDCPPYSQNSSRLDSPLEFINEMRNQYPDNDIRVVVPIINLDEEFRPNKKLSFEIEGETRVLEKTSISFEFFLQNMTQEAIVYKFPKNKNNIQVYGIFCRRFSYLKNISDLSKLQYLAPFVKSARIAIKRLAKDGFVPDIVHCENIPFFLGGEFEHKLPYQTKVLQVIKDFTQLDSAKTETFWAAINLADKSAMKKICRDNVTKACIARLFNLHNTKRFYQMKECLRFIYKNYYKFRKYIDKGEDIDENIIFNKLNTRITQLFPHLAQGDKLMFNPMFNSLKKADLWATYSKSYFKEIYENPIVSRNLLKILEKKKENGRYISFGCNFEKYPLENTRSVYQNFNSTNFRELRSKNKSALLKEFSADRIKTNFIDPTLFKSENVKIIGNLDSFYEAPLFFANPTVDVFSQGVDILFNTLSKLFETNKNIQIIICIKDGLKNNFIKRWVEFLSENKYFNGRWVFIDGEINLSKFLSATDIILIPRRVNSTSLEHLIAMHYGCVPVVSRTGVLNDTIDDIFDNISYGCGFKTKTSLMMKDDNNEIFISPVLKALNLYQNNPSSWNLLIRNCMNHDSNWNFKILEKYNKIYKELL